MIDTTEQGGLLRRNVGWRDGSAGEVHDSSLIVIGEDIPIEIPDDPTPPPDDPDVPWDGTPPENAIAYAEGYHASNSGVSLSTYTAGTAVDHVLAPRMSGADIVFASDKQFLVKYGRENLENPSSARWYVYQTSSINPIIGDEGTANYVLDSTYHRFYIPVNIVTTDTNAIDGQVYLELPGIGGQVFIRLQPVQTSVGVSASVIQYNADTDAATKAKLSASFAPRIIGLTDYLPMGTTGYRVVYDEDLTTLSETYYNVGTESYANVYFGTWKAYDFYTLEEAQAFLDSVLAVS